MIEIKLPFEFLAQVAPKKFTPSWYNNLKASLIPELIDWCNSNTPGWEARYEDHIDEETDYMIIMTSDPIILFKNKEHAIHFKLKWLGF